MAPNITTYTNAPEAYDYGYTQDTGIRVPIKYGSRTITLREVASPEKDAEYQRGRYLSGFYLALSFADLVEATPVSAA